MFKNLLIIAIAALTQAAVADNLYRYKNEVGGTVVDWQVPVEFIAKGYEVLDESGTPVLDDDGVPQRTGGALDGNLTMALLTVIAEVSLGYVEIVRY